MPSSSSPRTRTRILHYVVVHGAISRWFLKHDLPHVRGINGYPAVITKVNLSAAVLRFRHVLRRSTEALVSHFGLGHADAVNVARGEVRRTRQPNVQRV